MWCVRDREELGMITNAVLIAGRGEMVDTPLGERIIVRNCYLDLEPERVFVELESLWDTRLEMSSGTLD